MSLLIKGIEMPDSCLNCRFRTTILKNVLSPTMRASVYACLINGMEINNWYEEKHKDCPLVKIPTPHGRLIDADFLVHKLNLALLPIRCSASVDIDSMDENQKKYVRAVINQIKSAPTIIEAEV